MPRWDPGRIWEGEEVYIIGGGPSLLSFDWDLIRGKFTIGCNSNFVLGSDIVKLVLFCDTRWWKEIGQPGMGGDQEWWDKVGEKKFSEQFSPTLILRARDGYGGLVVGSHDELSKDRTPWLLHMPRHHSKEACTRGALTLFHNTGAAAINLALILGAKKVFLLGFDMKLGGNGEANWHHLRWQGPQADSYPIFLQQMKTMPASIARHFPGVEVINVTNDSKLDIFPKEGLAEHFNKVRERVR